MHIQRRALYNSLRQNWLLDPEIDVADWQIEDYRGLPVEVLLRRLTELGLPLDRHSFVAFADEYDSPEDLTDQFLLDRDDLDGAGQDQLYLLIFELWRRLLPERLCLSVFCDELDHQINLYDRGELERPESIQDELANLQEVLDENADQGVEPIEAFKAICDACANGLEAFLYDFISDQLDEGNVSYAAELVDGFYNYIHDTQWFDFLRARILVDTDPTAANSLFAKLISDIEDDPNLEFCLEILAYMVQGGERTLFVSLISQVLPWIGREEDFQELLSICVDFYRRLDYEWEEQALQAILDSRSHLLSDDDVADDDAHRKELLRVLEKRAV